MLLLPFRVTVTKVHTCSGLPILEDPEQKGPYPFDERGDDAD